MSEGKLAGRAAIVTGGYKHCSIGGKIDATYPIGMALEPLNHPAGIGVQYIHDVIVARRRDTLSIDECRQAAYYRRLLGVDS